MRIASLVGRSLLVSAAALTTVSPDVVAATTEATHVATDAPFSGFTLGAGLVAALAAGYYLRYFR
ncbi:hypothetical protein [Haladaptatus sp. ZSTT2]|uniref:hypothetical protein n=1 Tax=Haladaptatus sp. ZSTT2 TaxID=3120515 RepID=UPI00300F1AFD